MKDMELDKKALNLELLDFAGFTCTEGVWSYPDETTVDDGVPFFPKSFDDCLEWLVPAGNITDIHFMLDTGGTSQLPTCIIDTLGGSYTGYNENIKIAFCLAVKKLKDETSS